MHALHQRPLGKAIPGVLGLPEKIPDTFPMGCDAFVTCSDSIEVICFSSTFSNTSGGLKLDTSWRCLYILAAKKGGFFNGSYQ
jgi:hypothetical protein